MNTIIFLDIDGVLCTFSEYNRNRKKFWDKYDIAGTLKLPYEFNSGCVKVLNEILKETDADIVLTSDWRIHWNLKELDDIFKFNKVIKSPIDVTDVVPTSMSYLERNRGHEIDIYIKKHGIENYVIIDDLNLSEFVNADRFIHTKERMGLKETIIKEKILRILQNEPK